MMTHEQGPEVVVVRTGTANMASVLAGLRRAGATVSLTQDPREIERAGHLMVPGVGAFGATLAELRQLKLDGPLRARVVAGEQPTLGICMGMQLMCARSEESPGVVGLGALPIAVQRFPDSVHVPQLGWNQIEVDSGCRLLQPGFAYFANSYHLPAVPEGWTGAYATHGRRFVGAAEYRNVLLCQFHPELSGPWGIALMRRWLEVS
jgi:imidazole glycerol phosphate synthase glutamine amidotransferase subunit